MKEYELAHGNPKEPSRREPSGSHSSCAWRRLGLFPAPSNISHRANGAVEFEFLSLTFGVSDDGVSWLMAF
jgi:hypothetical protein